MLIEVKDIKQLLEFKDEPIYKDFNISNINDHEVNKHLLLLNDNKPIARASIWWEKTPKIEDKHVGTIGHFSANDKESAKFLLDKACEILKNHDIATVIGPMNGNTWRTYRFITNRGDQPIFFLEPNNPDDYPAYFLEAGFIPIEEYESAINYDLTEKDMRSVSSEERLKAEKITIRKLNRDEFEQDLNKIYEVSIASFKDNVLYTPMIKEEFFQQYMPIKEFIIPEFVLIAEDESKRPVGFMFALPDINQSAGGQEIDTVILKTLAVLPEKRSIGLGSLLINKVRETALEMNYKKSVCALMHKANNSRKIAAHFANTIRTYTLYSREI